LTFNVDVAQILNNYSEATIAIFNHFRAEFGSDLPIFVQEIGDFTPEPDPNAPNNNGDTYSLVRTAQQTVINSQANTFLAAETSGQIPELTLRGDRLHFNGDSYGVIATRLANTAVNVIADDSSVGGNESGLTHFGQPVTLVGANTPWTDVDGDTYAENFGALGINQTAITNRFADYFNDISSNQGNSARIWLHTTTRNTPIINAGGFVTGLSNLGIDPNTGQDRAIGQLRDILDRAWENGILITFSLFSFDMLCDSTVLDFGESTDELISHQSFLQNNNNQVQSYIDNALLPMVNSLRGHPALFAWEIFNEPEGMIQDFTAAGNFCREGALTHSTNITAIQNFITQTAIAIHNADPDVKVTTSSNTTDLENFTNDRLREVTGSNSNRILDFYQVHWYATPPEFPHLNPPHLFGPEAYTFDIDVPIVVGEYDVTDTGLELFGGNNPAPNQTGRGSRLSVIDILDRGYAGAWPWSIVTESSQNVGLIYEALRQPGLGLTQTQRNAICNTTNHEVCNN